MRNQISNSFFCRNNQKKNMRTAMIINNELIWLCDISTKKHWPEKNFPKITFGRQKNDENFLLAGQKFLYIFLAFFPAITQRIFCFFILQSNTDWAVAAILSTSFNTGKNDGIRCIDCQKLHKQIQRKQVCQCRWTHGNATDYLLYFISIRVILCRRCGVTAPKRMGSF